MKVNQTVQDILKDAQKAADNASDFLGMFTQTGQKGLSFSEVCMMNQPESEVTSSVKEQSISL